jgi:hypothetical protein
MLTGLCVTDTLTPHILALSASLDLSIKLTTAQTVAHEWTVSFGMNEYLSKEYIAKLLNTHLTDSRGAEHYAYDVVRRELMSAPGVVKIDAPTKKPLEVDKYDFGCPCCNENLGLQKEDIYIFEMTPPNYCSNCGQKLDWSDWE